MFPARGVDLQPASPCAKDGSQSSWLRNEKLARLTTKDTREDGAPVADVPTGDEVVGFDEHIKPLFRSRDRDSMRSHFDLWSYDDVSEHAGAILARVRAGTMPCDGAWPPEQVDLLQRWVDTGKPR
jgi:hypothetical protein